MPALVAGVCLCFASALPAQEKVAEMELAGDAVVWRPVVEYERLLLTVVGGESSFEKAFAAGEKIVYELVDQRGARLADGTYRYQLSTLWDAGKGDLELQRELREKNDPEALEEYRRRYAERRSKTQSGVLTIRGGKTVEAGLTETHTNKNRLEREGSVMILGDLEAAGKKSFVAADPEHPGETIHFVALEGPEAGTYFRTTARLVDGEAVIELPEHFTRVTEPDGVTVQLTPVGDWSRLYVVSRSSERLVVRSADGSREVEFDVLVHGVRRGFADHRPIQQRSEPLR